MRRPKNPETLLEAIHCQEPVAGLTHSFYKYPARFSPRFSRAVIEAFTEPGEVVYDPFMGGGTTIVEATAAGRRACGTDINSLGVFLAKVKTTVFETEEISAVRRWADSVTRRLGVWAPARRARDWAELGYQKNINTRETWRARKLIEIALAESEALEAGQQRDLARCIILRTAQWALDCRKEIPSVRDFRFQFLESARAIADGASQYSMAIREHQSKFSSPLCLHRSSVGVECEPAIDSYRPISLIVTSPPYPGVHVLYHRWQVQGRRKTPAPFWIASAMDGNGESYYTFGDRKEQTLDSYFTQALAAFTSIRLVMERDSVLVQMLAFSEPQSQLPRYIDVMERAGLFEMKFPEIANGEDGRTWRSVPHRKWYASQRGTTPSSSEVVLFHRAANQPRDS